MQTDEAIQIVATDIIGSVMTWNTVEKIVTHYGLPTDAESMRPLRHAFHHVGVVWAHVAQLTREDRLKYFFKCYEDDPDQKEILREIETMLFGKPLSGSLEEARA